MSKKKKPPESDVFPEPMQYGMLGEDDMSLRDKLEKYTGVVSWEYLKPHFESGALLYADPTIDIIEIGEALANDDTGKIQAWLKTGDLVKPSQPHADWWQVNPVKFTALVVTPFVIMQPLPPKDETTS